MELSERLWCDRFHRGGVTERVKGFCAHLLVPNRANQSAVDAQSAVLVGDRDSFALDFFGGERPWFRYGENGFDDKVELIGGAIYSELDRVSRGFGEEH
jgi:hypothetical protein